MCGYINCGEPKLLSSKLFAGKANPAILINPKINMNVAVSTYPKGDILFLLSLFLLLFQNSHLLDHDISFPCLIWYFELSSCLNNIVNVQEGSSILNISFLLSLFNKTYSYG